MDFGETDNDNDSDKCVFGVDKFLDNGFDDTFKRSDWIRELDRDVCFQRGGDNSEHQGLEHVEPDQRVTVRIGIAEHRELLLGIFLD